MAVEIAIRKPLRAEIPHLAQLGKELFMQTFDGLYSPTDLDSFLNRAFNHEGIAADWDDGCEFWIATSDDKWMGYCKAGPVRVPVTQQTSSNVLELRQMYVERSFHRQRVGSRFMHLFLELCQQRKIDQAFISCWSENAKALAFYRSFGFEVIGEYDFLVGQHRDREFILSKNFVSSS